MVDWQIKLLRNKLIALWLLQTVFLRSFYNGMVIRNVEKAAAQIAAGYVVENFDGKLDSLAYQYSLLIFITDPDGSVSCCGASIKAKGKVMMQCLKVQNDDVLHLTEMRRNNRIDIKVYFKENHGILPVKNSAKGWENDMCGRYYVDDETAREIEKLVKTVNDKLRLERLRKDIYPTDEAPVLAAGNREMKLEWQHWGFPGLQGKGVIFNARSETVLEKKMFRESVLHRRIIIPCTWFYEWNRKKEKVTFYRQGVPVIFLAGFYNVFGDEKRFTVLTTGANQSMVSTHDRMPLIIGHDQIKDWVLDDTKFSGMLKQTPVLLEMKQEYEQQELKLR